MQVSNDMQLMLSVNGTGIGGTIDDLSINISFLMLATLHPLVKISSRAPSSMFDEAKVSCSFVIGCKCSSVFPSLSKHIKTSVHKLSNESF